jgi:cation diffusion facilitator CzcD-associated flavoprotein CzcO
MTTHYAIAVVGGGLGGLTTARVLHANGIGSVIFRADSPQGLVDMFAGFDARQATDTR